MTRLDRYILSETLGPLVLGFGVYTFIMLLRFLFRSADLIIRRGLAAGEVGELVLLTLPNIVVLTIPMSLLFGILLAIGRLASDSELIAMRATGISLFALYRPILYLSLVLTLVNGVLTAIVLPRANNALQTKQYEILAQTASRQVEPRVFYEEWRDFVLYVFEIPPGGETWEGVFLAPSIPRGEHVLAVAERGRVRTDEKGERVVLELEDALVHSTDLGKSNYQVSAYERYASVLEDSFATSQRASLSVSKGVRMMTLSELRQLAVNPSRSPELRRLAEVEIHKKFSIPAACLVFGLFAVPLGFNNRRGGKSSGFALSIGVILVYYILLSNGEDAARVGKMSPWLSMWLPNFLFTVVGLFLLARRNRDKSLLLTRLDRWLRSSAAARVRRFRRRRKALRQLRKQARRSRQAPGRRAPGPDLVLRIPRFSLRFPNLIDRYVIALFSRVLAIVTLSGVSIYVIADLTENIDEIFRFRPPGSVIAKYYTYMSLQIFFDIAPILVLVTTLLTFGLLSRSSEVTAAKALGISLYRLALPALAVAAVVASGCLLLQTEVLPASNQKVAKYKDRIKGKSARTYRHAERQWVFGQGPYIFNYLYYDPDRGALRDLQVFFLDDQRHLTRRIYAEEAVFQGERWVLSRGWARSFQGADVTAYYEFSRPVLTEFTEPPDYFTSPVQRPEQMSFRQLARYVEELERSGQSVPELEVALYNKIAFPAVSLVMALVALPFAFQLGQRHGGALYGVGLSLVLGMVLLGVFAFFSKLGEAGALPPLAAVWGPNLIFGSLSLYLFLGVRT